MTDIGKVKDLECGQTFVFNNCQCVIESFSTRYMLVLKNVNPRPGQWIHQKTSIKEFQKTAKRVEDELPDTKCSYKWNNVRCCLTFGHTGFHKFKCASPNCKGLAFPASVTRHQNCEE